MVLISPARKVAEVLDSGADIHSFRKEVLLAYKSSKSIA